MSGNTSREPLVFSVVEDLRRQGYNQSEIAHMHGVTRQAVSWQKHTYGGSLTPRQVVHKAWPWKTGSLHGRSKAYQRLRDHGQYMAQGNFDNMSVEKISLLKKWWKMLRDESLVLEFDPNIPPEAGTGIAPYGGFAYRVRVDADGDLLIRVNGHTELRDGCEQIWGWPQGIDSLI